VLLAALVIVACDTPGMNDQQLLQRAKGYLVEREINAAAIELRNALQENPDNAEARYLLGLIYLDYGDFLAAEKEFRRAGKAGWNEADTFTGLARVLAGQKNYKRLVDKIEVKDSFPVTVQADLLALRAVAEAGLGDPDQAGTTLAEAARLDADAFQVLNATVQLQLVNGQSSAAKDTLAAALREYPDNPELLLLAAGMAAQEKDESSAIETYQRVIDSDTDGFITLYGSRARLSLAQLHILAQDLDQAEALLKPLYRRNPGDPYLNYLGGLLAFLRGDYDKAEEHLLKVLKLASEHVPTRLLFGTVNYAQQDYEQAAYFLSKYIAAVPDNLPARKLLGRSYIILGQHDNARLVLQPATNETVADAELLALVGISELRRGNTAAGITGLEKAVAANPENIAIRRELASIYIKAGETGLAIQELNVILEKGGQLKRTEVLLVYAHLSAGEFDAAINITLDLLAGYPDDPVIMTLTGNVFAASGDTQEARKYFERALQVEPGFPPATLSLARIEELDGNTAEAVALYEGLVDSEDKSEVPMLALARLAGKQGNKQGMVGWLKRAIEQAPGEVKPRISLARYYLRENQMNQARTLVNEVVQLSPQEPEVLELQGRLFMAERRYQEALSPLTELVGSKPGSVTARLRLAECQIRLGLSKKARKELDSVLQQQANNMVALMLLAQLEIRDGGFDQALEHSQRIQQEYPELYLGYQLEGDVRTARQEYEGAGRAYAQAWERMESPELAFKRAENSTRTGNPDVAVARLQAWLRGNPDDVRARQFLGATYQKLGQEDMAVQAYEEVLDADPENLVALNNLAGLYAHAKRPEALEMAKRAYRANPDHPGIQDTYGWILVQNDQVGKGHRLLIQAMEQLPDNPEVRYHYAVALLKSGERVEGRKLLNELLQSREPFESREEAQALLGE